MMDLITFTAHFKDDKSCRDHFKALRDKAGIACKKCGGVNHYWLNSKSVYQCKKCSFRTSLRSGTIMENSKLPFLTWYKVMFLLATKKDISCKEIQRQLNLKRYEPVWTMVHKLKKLMEEKNDSSLLTHLIEIDEDFPKIDTFKETEIKPQTKNNKSNELTIFLSQK